MDETQECELIAALGAGDLGGLTAEVGAARDVEALAAAAAGARSAVDRLLRQQASADAVTRAITIFNDRVTRRLIAILDPHGTFEWAGACWIALGSQGRSEQTLATDQDNGIVFADTADAERVRGGLLPLARQVNEALDRCGFPLCRGDVMAGNPKWCLSASEWRRRFAQWIEVPEPQALLNASIFFDFRPIHGRFAAAEELRAWLAQFAEDRGRFLLPMVLNALQHRPPLGLLRAFTLERGGGHPGTLDLKVNGVQLFVESARVYGLASGVTATSTLDRFAALAERRGIPALELDAWSDAFRHVQLARLKLNAAQQALGEPLHNHLDPATLNAAERRGLRQALQQARRLQSRIARDFSLGSVGYAA
jgi:CBS domain-containing protein